MEKKLLIGYIAKTCHEANRIWCQANSDDSQKHWAEAEQWQRDSAIKGVEFRLDNPNAPQSAQHDAWMKEKIAEGWVYGETKDSEKKTHPCLVTYDELPEFQKKKDALFCAIVDSLKVTTNHNPIKVGDVVVLKSGGPELTVAKCPNQGGVILCNWFAGDILEQGIFNPNQLVKAW